MSQVSQAMFQRTPRVSGVYAAASLAELIYHSTVRSIRKGSGNALVGLLMNVSQTIILVLTFYVMFTVLGLRGNAIRGDFLLYIMTGIFLFMTHSKALGAVMGSEGPTSAMMKHAPMNTVIAISAAALSSLYTQLLSVFVVLFLYHVAWTPVHIEDPIGALGMILLSWFTGVAIGMVFLAAKPWAPGFFGLAASIYSRANMIASGKMFLANTLPHWMLTMFDWNPLFHTIDQARGFTFINYNPHYSTVSYPVYVGITLLMIGLMGEFFTRKRVSLSWTAGQ